MRCERIGDKIRIIAEGKEDFSGVDGHRLFTCLECIEGKFYLRSPANDCPFMVNGKCTVDNCCGVTCLTKEAGFMGKEFDKERSVLHVYGKGKM